MSMSEWIKCRDRLPAGPMDVLVYCDDTKEQFVAFRDRGLFTFATDHEGNAISCNPTHWQPLGPPPSKEQP